jgi:hypothetical protein
MQATWVQLLWACFTTIYNREEEEKLLPQGEELFEGVLCMKLGSMPSCSGENLQKSANYCLLI